MTMTNSFSDGLCRVLLGPIHLVIVAMHFFRRWVQAVLQLSSVSCSSITETDIKAELLSKESSKSDSGLTNSATESEIDLSEGMAEMFGISNSNNEIIEVNVADWSLKIEVLPKENQHTCKSTGLMLWESARLLASVLAANQHIVAGKRVLELGCGCGGICSMISSKSADFVVATDGDEKALEFLSKNVCSNLKPSLLAKLNVKKLEWSNIEHMEAVKDSNDIGFNVILGTDFPSQSIISSWFTKDGQEDIPTTALNIMYFTTV